MTRDHIVQLLKEHRSDFERLGVKSLAGFGSVARDEMGPGSDVDCLVEFEGKATFDRYMDLKFLLETLLECSVDLITQKALKPRLRPYIEKEAIYVS